MCARLVTTTAVVATKFSFGLFVFIYFPSQRAPVIGSSCMNKQRSILNEIGRCFCARSYAFSHCIVINRHRTHVVYATKAKPAFYFTWRGKKSEPCYIVVLSTRLAWT